MTTKEIISLGYKITSRKYRIASRIDREDWVEFMKNNNYTHLSRGAMADQYRRVYSKDKIIVSIEQLKEIPNSGAER